MNDWQERIVQIREQVRRLYVELRQARQRASGAERALAENRRGLVRVLDASCEVLDVLYRQEGGQAGDEDVAAAAREMRTRLGSVGLEAYLPEVGQTPDTEWQVIVDQETGVSTPPGTISRVVAPGYRMEGELLRKAYVLVAGQP